MQKFYGDLVGEIAVVEIRLVKPKAQPDEAGWSKRFELTLEGKTERPPVNAWYVEGILDKYGNWIADFAEPTEDKPTKL